MIIDYLGHSAFRIKDYEDTGYQIMLDPYEPDSVPGLLPIDLHTTIVLNSHDHFDHTTTEGIEIRPCEEECPYDIEVIDCWHDNQQGALRGANKVHIITLRATGEKIVHYGDLGEEIDAFLTPENLEKVKDATVAMIPVGGYYTIDGHQAFDLIQKTTPKMALPMHYRSERMKLGFDELGTVEDFLEYAMENWYEARWSMSYQFDTLSELQEGAIVALRPVYAKSLNRH